MIRHILLGILATCIFHTTDAQDIIYKSNGVSEKAKIIEINTKTVKYKRWDNQDGPDFVVPVREVKRIKWENGSEERFDNSENLKPVKTTISEAGGYGKNIIAIAPIWMTNTSAVGVGFSYERMIDKHSIFSIVIPVAYSFNNQNRSNYNSYENNRNSTMFWAYPGAKIYLGSRHDGKLRYALGLAIPIGSGAVEEDRMIYNPTTGTNTYTTVTNNIFMMGAMVNNSFNIQATQKIYLGIELGLGIPYFVNESQDDNWQSGNYIYIPYGDGQPIINFNFRIGYRF